MARPGALSIVLLLAVRALAINEEMGTRNLVQPDGTRFPVREYVDEFGHYLVAEKGYVVQDTTTGYYHYARYDRDGRATPSPLRVGRDDGSDKVGRLNSENVQALRESAWRLQGFDSAGAAATTGVFPDSLIVILVEFSDVKHQNSVDWPMAGVSGSKNSYPEYTVSDFETMLFAETPAGTPRRCDRRTEEP